MKFSGQVTRTRRRGINPRVRRNGGSAFEKDG
jgi:hypothetical protein